jgi:hypothetical protein
MDELRKQLRKEEPPDSEAKPVVLRVVPKATANA